MDPLSNQLHNWSKYSYACDNPILYIDVNGHWPGLTIFLAEAEVGFGLAYGLNYVEQKGIVWDEVGKTHFEVSSAIYVLNQNINKDYILGISGGFTIGFVQDWKHSTWDQVVGNSITGGENGLKGMVESIGSKAPTLKLKAGVGISIGEDSFGLNVGVAAGLKITVLQLTVNESISVTDDQEDVIDDTSPIFNESWSVGNIKEIRENNKVVGYEGEVFAHGAKGGSGVKVYSGILVDGGKVKSNNVWASKEYKEAAKIANEEEK